MPAFTTNQWAILFLVLVLGWILGLASRAGGKKWKRALAEERDARAESDRRQAEELATARARIAELERAAVRVPVAPAPAPVAPTPVTTTTPLRDDDLGLIRGIGPVGAERLAEQGVTRYRQLIALDVAGKADLERRLGAPDGTIDRDDWQGQASLLDDGRDDEHRRRFAS